MLFSVGLALLAAPAHAEDWPAGATLDNALVADITPEGFDSIAALIPALLPSFIEIPDTSGSGGYWCFNYEYGLGGGWVSIVVSDARIVPMDGYLDVTANLLVNVNDAADPFQLYTEVACIGSTCGGHVTPFPVDLHTTIALDVVSDGAGGQRLDATLGAFEIDNGLSSSDIQLDGCALGTIEDVLNFLGLSLFDLILGPLEDALLGSVGDLGPTLESTIEDAFASATIQQTVDLNGVPLEVNLAPTDVTVTPAGVRVALGGGLDAAAAPCVAAYDTGGSLKTPSDPPGIGAAPAGISTPYHVGIGISDDFTNQALYAVWRGGVLCYTLGADAGIPLDTGILNALTGDALAPLFPESRPVTLRTVPRAAPTLALEGDHDLDLQLNQFDLEFYAQLDGRAARVLAVQLDGTVGADLGFDGATGALDVTLDLAADRLTPSVSYNELVPDANDTILGSFGTTFGNLLDTVVGGLLPELAFTLPAFNGIGLQDLQIATNGDWLGGYAFVGSVPYGAGDGCGGCGGDSSGCGGGCTVGGTSVPHPLWVVLGALVFLRRKR